MRHFFGRRLLLVTALLAVGAAGGIAYATGAVTSSDSGIITVCVNQTGAARFVDTATQCKKGEHAVLLAAAASQQPSAFSVDCSAGQTIQGVEGQVALAAKSRPVTVDIKGVCTGDAFIGTSDSVTYSGVSPDAQIRSLHVASSRDIQVDHLTIGDGGLMVDASDLRMNDIHLTGGASINGASSLNVHNGTFDHGLDVLSGMADISDSTITHGVEGVSDSSVVGCEGGTVWLRNVVVSDGIQDGIGAWGTCGVTVENSTVRDNARGGLTAWQSASIDVRDGSVIRDNAKDGALAHTGGTVWITDSTISGNGQAGVAGYVGGHVNVTGSTVEDNGWNGIALMVGSTGGVGGTTIQNNAGDGVWVQDTSVLGGGGNTITGNTNWGIWCQPAPATAQISGWDLSDIGTVSGNTTGQVSCPISGQPSP